MVEVWPEGRIGPEGVAAVGMVGLDEAGLPEMGACGWGSG